MIGTLPVFRLRMDGTKLWTTDHGRCVGVLLSKSARVAIRGSIFGMDRCDKDVVSPDRIFELTVACERVTIVIAPVVYHVSHALMLDCQGM
jgi:hypothetical protein